MNTQPNGRDYSSPIAFQLAWEEWIEYNRTHNRAGDPYPKTDAAQRAFDIGYLAAEREAAQARLLETTLSLI